MFLQSADVNITHATVTASVGEPVTLEVATSLSDITWRKDNAPVSAWNGLTRIDLTPVQISDEGIYECHQVGKHSEGKHAIMRLIVRGKANLM